MGHPAQHSCTDLSVYCYLLNSLPIATLLLPCHKPALLFFSFIPCCFLLLCWSLNYSPPFPLIPFFELSGFIQICFLSGFTSLFWFDPGYSAETCKQTGLKKKKTHCIYSLHALSLEKSPYSSPSLENVFVVFFIDINRIICICHSLDEYYQVGAVWESAQWAAAIISPTTYIPLNPE